uniref:Small secreted gut protein G10K2 n=1 Tax=Mayetiola destructor TaxID=39758 RepID=Q1KQZ5_MAYDE|nr:small secreted gut protein G10K2 [Mayetiola destructor]
MKLLLFIVVGALFCVMVKSSESSPFTLELINKNVFIIVKRFQCLIDVIKRISNDNGLADQWSQSEPVIQYFLNRWLNCHQAGRKWAVILCHIQLGPQLIRVLRKYLQSVAVQKPQVIQLIGLEYLKSCTFVGLIEQVLPEISNEQETILSNNEVQSALPWIWSRYRTHLDELFAHIEACIEPVN